MLPVSIFPVLHVSDGARSSHGASVYSVQFKVSLCISYTVRTAEMDKQLSRLLSRNRENILKLPRSGQPTK